MDYCAIEWFALETNRDHSVVFEIASKYCISDSFVDHDGYSRVMCMRFQFPSRSLGVMTNGSHLFPSHMFYPLGTPGSGHWFGVHMPPRGRCRSVTGAISKLLHNRTSTGCSIPLSGRQFAVGAVVLTVVYPLQHLVTKIHATGWHPLPPFSEAIVRVAHVIRSSALPHKSPGSL